MKISTTQCDLLCFTASLSVRVCLTASVQVGSLFHAHCVSSLCPTREHHDCLLHDGPDGGLHCSVRSLQLRRSGVSGAPRHPQHAPTRQRHGVLSAHVKLAKKKQKKRTNSCTQTRENYVKNLKLRWRLEPTEFVEDAVFFFFLTDLEVKVKDWIPRWKKNNKNLSTPSSSSRGVGRLPCSWSLLRWVCAGTQGASQGEMIVCMLAPGGVPTSVPLWSRVRSLGGERRETLVACVSCHALVVKRTCPKKREMSDDVFLSLLIFRFRHVIPRFLTANQPKHLCACMSKKAALLALCLQPPTWFQLPGQTDLHSACEATKNKTKKTSRWKSGDQPGRANSTFCDITKGWQTVTFSTYWMQCRVISQFGK